MRQASGKLLAGLSRCLERGRAESRGGRALLLQPRSSGLARFWSGESLASRGSVWLRAAVLLVLSGFCPDSVWTCRCLGVSLSGLVWGCPAVRQGRRRGRRRAAGLSDRAPRTAIQGALQRGACRAGMALRHERLAMRAVAVMVARSGMRARSRMAWRSGMSRRSGMVRRSDMGRRSRMVMRRWQRLAVVMRWRRRARCQGKGHADGSKKQQLSNHG